MPPFMAELLVLAALAAAAFFVFIPRLQGRTTAYVEQQEDLLRHQAFKAMTEGEPMVHATVGEFYMTSDPNLIKQDELVEEREYMPALLTLANGRLFVLDEDGEVLFDRDSSKVRLEVRSGYCVFHLGAQLYILARDLVPLGLPLNDRTFARSMVLGTDAFWLQMLNPVDSP